MARILHMSGGSIEPIDSTKFLKEANLHDYLEKYPELIPFEEIEDDPPTALVIGREVSVRSGSIDLLIIDASGRLTIVETKLAKNPEARREVVGQVIEYASFVSQWTADQVEHQAVDYLKCGSAEEFYLRLSTKDQSVEPIDATAFKIQVEKNLKDGNLRLVIAVDEIVESLRSIVVFLNSFTRFDFVLLQLHEYSLGNDDHVFIPSLFGQMKPTSQRPPTRTWDKKSFFEESTGIDPKIRAYVEKIYDRFYDWTVEEYWGSGTVLGFLQPACRHWRSQGQGRKTIESR